MNTPDETLEYVVDRERSRTSIAKEAGADRFLLSEERERTHEQERAFAKFISAQASFFTNMRDAGEDQFRTLEKAMHECVALGIPKAELEDSIEACLASIAASSISANWEVNREVVPDVLRASFRPLKAALLYAERLGARPGSVRAMMLEDSTNSLQRTLLDIAKELTLRGQRGGRAVRISEMEEFLDGCVSLGFSRSELMRIVGGEIVAAYNSYLDNGGSSNKRKARQLRGQCIALGVDPALLPEVSGGESFFGATAQAPARRTGSFFTRLFRKR